MQSCSLSHNANDSNDGESVHLFIFFVLFYSFSTEGELGGSCATAASDSCSDSNAQCNGGTCECNSGYYDNDGISNNNAGTCVLRKYDLLLPNICILNVSI